VIEQSNAEKALVIDQPKQRKRKSMRGGGFATKW